MTVDDASHRCTTTFAYLADLTSIQDFLNLPTCITHYTNRHTAIVQGDERFSRPR